MKRIISAIAIALFIIIMCSGFTSFELEIPNTIKTENLISQFSIEKIIQFEDENINNYSIQELQDLINEYNFLKLSAHELADSARKLGWPEDSEAIQMAKIEYWNAERAVRYYTTKYNELNAVWASRSAEFPAATEIWLYMKDLGWNDYVCAGILGNMMAEVGGQTLDLQYTLSNSHYYGMCQWSKKYYSEVNGATLSEQCNFLRDTIKYEIDTFGYAYAKDFNFASFLELTDEKTAALAFAKTYERCSSASYAVRQANATKALEYFTD